MDSKVVHGNARLSGPPFLLHGCDTLAKLFLHRCQSLGERTAHREKALGIWKSHSWAAFLDAARAIGLGLAALGLKRGEVVSILSEDCKEWIYADLGVQCVGGIVSGIYTTDSAEQVAYLLADSRSRFLIVENEEQLEKFLAVRDRVPEVAKCIVLDREGLHDFSDDRVLFLDELYDLGRGAHASERERFRRGVEASRPDDVALLVYTSGTTGPPKGAMITHENVICSVASVLRTTPVLEGDEQLCFLPLCHILERLVSVFVPIAAKSVVNFAESLETVFDNLREVSPHSFTAVPRMWEKMHSRLEVLAAEATPLGRLGLPPGGRLRNRARRLPHGRPPGPAPASRRGSGCGTGLVLANVRRMIGLDRARTVTTGAAPISSDLVRWYWAIGLVMLEGYGLTESSGALTLNRPDANRTGSVGRPVPGVEMKIAADGEILARAPGVFRGYWNDPRKTARTVRDGWLHTGDVGADRRRRLHVDHRAHQGHHHHRRRQERRPGRDREPDEVLALDRGRRGHRRPAPVPCRAHHDRPGERGAIRAGAPRAVLGLRLAVRRRAGAGADRGRGGGGERGVRAGGAGEGLPPDRRPPDPRGRRADAHHEDSAQRRREKAQGADRTDVLIG